jgi:hypothetical protein
MNKGTIAANELIWDNSPNQRLTSLLLGPLDIGARRPASRGDTAVIGLSLFAFQACEEALMISGHIQDVVGKEGCLVKSHKDRSSDSDRPTQ